MSILLSLGECVAPKVSEINVSGMELLAKEVLLETKNSLRLKISKGKCYYGEIYLFSLTPTKSAEHNASVVLRDLLNYFSRRFGCGIEFVKRDMDSIFIFSLNWFIGALSPLFLFVEK